MPICFKCGKNLATDQSLQYHLQKRVKCNTLNCTKCKKQFPNKLLLDNHRHECIPENELNLRYTIFDQIQSKNIYIIELNNIYNVNYISDNYENLLNCKNNDIINNHINNVINLDSVLNSKIKNTKMTHDNINFEIVIKYNTENILIIETIL